MLFSTFGYDRKKVTRAMRAIPHDRLVIVTSEDNTHLEDYEQIMDIARISGVRMDTLLVDKFDLMSSFQAIVGAIRERMKAKDSVFINISGGTPLLADAALLAAFETGVEAYHVGEVAVRLPVLRGVSIEEVLGAEERKALLAYRPGLRLQDIKALGPRGEDLTATFLKLKRMGLVLARLDARGTIICLSPKGEYYKRGLEAEARRDDRRRLT